MRTLAALAQTRVFASTTEAHLKVGHTHEDIDALFALIAGGLRSASPSSLQTPKDLARRIDEKMKPLFEKKDLSWGIELVQTVSCLQFNVPTCTRQNLQAPKMFLGWFLFYLNKIQSRTGWRWEIGSRFCLTLHLSRIVSGPESFEWKMLVNGHLCHRCLHSCLAQDTALNIHFFCIPYVVWREKGLFPPNLSCFGGTETQEEDFLKKEKACNFEIGAPGHGGQMQMTWMMSFAWWRPRWLAHPCPKSLYWCFQLLWNQRHRNFFRKPIVPGALWDLTALKLNDGMSCAWSGMLWRKTFHTSTELLLGMRSCCEIHSQCQSLRMCRNWAFCAISLLGKKMCGVSACNPGSCHQSHMSYRWCFIATACRVETGKMGLGAICLQCVDPDWKP